LKIETRVRVVCCITLFLGVGSARGQEGNRELPDFYVPGGAPISVSIHLMTPGSVAVVGAEDLPPADWIISSISNGGTFDTVSGKVKWGPLFAPNIPASLSYSAASPHGSNEEPCFLGTVAFDGDEIEIGGDSCISAAAAVPAMGLLGFIVLSVGVFGAAAWSFRRKPQDALLDS